MNLSKEIAVISKSGSMVTIFEESDLPEWAGKMIQIRIDDKVTGSGISGTVDMFGYDRRAIPQAIVKTNDGSRHRVSLLKLKKL